MREPGSHPLTRIREQQNLTQNRLAEVTRISARTIMRAEQNKLIAAESRRRLCEYFALTAEELGLQLPGPLATPEMATEEEEVRIDTARENASERSSFFSLPVTPQQGEISSHLAEVMKQEIHLSRSHNALPLSIPSFLQTDVDVLARLSLLLNKPSVVNEKEIHYFDQQTRLYWRAREETVLPATTLYDSVIRHIDNITMLLARSHVPLLRLYLCEIVCRAILLAGILLYDMGQYVKARQHYLVSLQAAREANNPTLQAVIWGWMSFTWTYTKNYTEALDCVCSARSFALQTTDSIMKAWLSAIEAEIQAHLHHRDVCLQALSNMEYHCIGGSPSQDTSYLFEFNPVLLLGYKGVCLQQFYRRQEPATHRLLQDAKESLEQALASEAPIKRKLYYLSDLASVYARQGEVETACSYIVKSIPLIMQVGSGSKTIRKHLLQARMLLQPHEHTSFVQTLDTQMAPLLIEMQTEEA